MLSVNNLDLEEETSVDSGSEGEEENVQSNLESDYPASINDNSNSCEISEKHFSCYRCDKSFPSYQDVVNHLKLIHNACASRDCSKILDFKMHSSVCMNRGFGCTICDMKFSEKYLLLMHFNEHIGAAFYVCEVCRDGFQQRKDLQRHLLQIHKRKNVCVPVKPSHSKVVYQKCGQCSKYFKLFAEYEEHSSSCCNSITYACPTCKVHFPTLSALDEHRFAEHRFSNAVKGHLALKCGKRYFCALCYIGFSKGTILKKHLETHEMEVSYICDVCHSSFACDDDLQSHYLLHIEEHYILHDVISQHSCNSCKKTFNTQKELKNHLLSENCKSHNENYSVLPSEQLKVKDTSSSNYIGNSVTTYDKESGENNSSALQNGLESEVNSSTFDTSQVPIYALKAGEDLLNCDDVQCIIVMDLKSLFVLQRGICASENRMPDIKNSQAYDEDEVIDAILLQTHMLQILCPSNDSDSLNSEYFDSAVNSEIPPYLEQDLNTDSGAVESRSVDTDELNVQPSVSEDNKIYYETLPVAVCEDSTNSENGNEVYEVMNDDNILSNAELKEGSANVVVAEENQVPHNNESPENGEKGSHTRSADGFRMNNTHICNICRQVFSSKTSLCLHMKGKHTGFDCYRCGNSFNSEEALANHEKISHHSAFQCDMCDVSYPKEYLLKKHKRGAHGGKHFICNICDKSYVLKNEYEVHLMIHRGETPPTKCEFCGKVYASISNYMRHKAIHEGKSPPKKYICTICDKGFVARNPLKRHLSTHIRRTTLSYECPKCKMYFPPKLFNKHVESHNTAS